MTKTQLPASHRTAHLFIDESGIARQSPVTVLGALRFSNGHGRLVNELNVFRDRVNWRAEMHFSEVTRYDAHLYREVIRLLAASDARFTCLVVDRGKPNPFYRESRKDAWRSQAQAAIALINRTIHSDEIVAVSLDQFSVPVGVNFEGYVRSAVNRAKGRLAVASVCRLDSRACWGIQLCDVLAGAVGHQYRQAVDPKVRAGNPKGQLATFVAEQFNVETLVGASTNRLRVYDAQNATRPRRRLEVVTQRSAS